MAAVAQGEIDKVELKKLLIKSKKEPVHCAVATDKDGAALIMLHKIKQPRALAKELEKEFGDIRNPRFGSAFVDIDENPKLVILTLNKASPGIARKMKKTLKGTGFTKVRVVLEDGSVAEAVEEEEDGDEAPETEGTEAAPAEAPVAQPAPEAEPAFDVAGLTKRLTELAKRMVQAMAADPSRQDALKALAVQAQNAVKARDAAAEELIGQFETALDAVVPAVAQDGAVPPAVPFAKARLVWVAARGKVQGELDKLLAEMAATYKDHGFGADLDRVVRTKVEPMLESLDDRLAHKLDEVTAASDPATHAKLVQEARAIIDSYEAYIAGEPLIAKLDANPFVPLQIEKTLAGTLAALSRVIA